MFLSLTIPLVRTSCHQNSRSIYVNRSNKTELYERYLHIERRNGNTPRQVHYVPIVIYLFFPSTVKLNFIICALNLKLHGHYVDLDKTENQFFL